MNKMYDFFKTLDKGYITYGSHKIRIIIDKNDKFWFNAQDITTSLDYKNKPKAVRQHVDLDDKIRLKNIKHDSDITGIQPDSIYITEAGLYSLILSSMLPDAKKFKHWVTHDVLPSIHRYGYYQTKVNCDDKITSLQREINYFKKEKTKTNFDCKKQKYPDGGTIYVVDYSTKYESIYRIGMSHNLEKRDKLYATHNFHNHKIVIFEETKCPPRFESCIKSMLKDYQYNPNGKIKKDFYLYSLEKIKTSINQCRRSINRVDQTGGSKRTVNDIYLEPYNNFMNDKINKLSSSITKLSKKSEKINAMLIKNLIVN